jgi:hypothetical protein
MTGYEEFEQRYKPCLLEALERVKSSYVSLAALVVKMLDEDRRATERLLGELGTGNLLTRLELLGRGALDERLVKIGANIVPYLQKLPVYEQKRLLDEGVPVVLADKPDEHLMVDVAALWPAQRKQVFGKNGVRSLAVLWLIDQALRKAGEQPVALEPELEPEDFPEGSLEPEALALLVRNEEPGCGKPEWNDEGKYDHTCAQCGAAFVGGKGRTICAACGVKHTECCNLGMGGCPVCAEPHAPGCGAVKGYACDCGGGK